MGFPIMGPSRGRDIHLVAYLSLSICALKLAKWRRHAQRDNLNDSNKYNTDDCLADRLQTTRSKSCVGANPQKCGLESPKAT